MEDDLTFLGKWKTTSIFWKMKDDLNFLEKGRQPKFLDPVATGKICPSLARLRTSLTTACIAKP